MKRSKKERAKVKFTPLPERGVIRITGPDARTLLQGLITNDIMKVSPSRAIYAALLTPQGKYLFDFLIAQHGEALLMETERARRGDLLRKLTLYRLRAEVDFADVSDDMPVGVLFGDGAAAHADLPSEAGACAPCGDGLAFVDPRQAALGVRILGAPGALAETAAAADATDYDAHRLALGVPEGSRDMLVDKSLILECGFEALNGVDFTKGCYVGQEQTARTKHRATLRHALFPVILRGPAPPPGTPVMAGDKAVGVLGSSAGGRALARLRISDIEAGAALSAGDATLEVRRS
jgi:folate-binding protein YgfZ